MSDIKYKMSRKKEFLFMDFDTAFSAISAATLFFFADCVLEYTKISFFRTSQSDLPLSYKIDLWPNQ